LNESISNTVLFEILEKVRREVTPSQELKIKINRIVDEFIEELHKIIKENNIKGVKPQLVGSFKKDTWLPQRVEIDLFLVYESKDMLKKDAEKHLELFKTIYDEWEDRHAQHPYIHGVFKGINIDIVPALKIKNARERYTAVDRTPLHTKYVLSKINAKLSSEIRILKLFLQNADIYGAEIKIKGFSGYLCELLILFYGSFLELLHQSQKWKYGEVIDIEKHYKNEHDVKTLFDSPLIVIDPVDASRNVAAALSEEKFNKFKVLARDFLNNPAEVYFFPKEFKAPKFTEVINKLNNTLFIVMQRPKISEDILWGQIHSSLKGIERFLQLHDFKIKKTAAWSDEKNTLVFIIVFESLERNRIKRFLGPKIGGIGEKEFLAKHSIKKENGERITQENGRWIRYITRKITSAKEFLLEKFNSKKLDDIKLGSHIKNTIIKNVKVLSGPEVEYLYDENKDFARIINELTLN